MIMKLVKYAWLIFLHSLFLFVSALSPKDKNLWVFGSWKGENYTDNTKYLFEYLIQEHPDCKCVWVTRNDNVYNTLKQSRHFVVKIGTLSWFFTLMRASAAFETEGNADIGGYRPARCKIIQLWHGYGGKNCKWNKRDNCLISFFKRIVFDDRQNSYWMVPSEYAIQSVKRNFFVDSKQCFITGSPRNDYILNAEPNKAIDNLHLMNSQCKKIIAYMPTHRNFGLDGNPQLTVKLCEKINNECKKRKAIFFFKPHFHEMKHYAGLKTGYSNIVIADTEESPEYADLYSYLGNFDLLISDYSSVIYDYLCSKKPVILFPYDAEKYKITDGIPDTYFENPCGPICYSWDEVFAQMDMLFENDQWVMARECNRKNIHQYDDGLNCERIYEQILQLLGIRKE